MIVTGIIVLIIAFVFVGVAMADGSTVIAADSLTRQIPGVAQLVNGRLDITVTVVTPSWTMDLVNTNTAVSIVGTSVPIGTYISFKGRLIGTDGNAIPNYWVTVNLLAQGKVAESGNQCWLGSAQTDSNGYFGSGYSVQVRSDGWFSTYPGVANSDGSGNYVQTKNGAGNPGCQAWATTNPAGLTYSGYAAVSGTYYSSAPSFTVTAPVSCSVTGTVYVNDVVVSPGNSIRTPPAIKWDFVTSTPSSVSKVTLSWSGTASGSVDMQSVSSGKWETSNTLAQGTYTVKMVVTCTVGGTTPVLSIDTTVRPGSTEVINIIQELRDNLLYISIPFFGLAAVLVGYGIRKER
jgi:hypothetical protein